MDNEFLGKMFNAVKKFGDDLINGDSGCKTCGIAPLDVLLKPFDTEHPETHFVIIKDKNPKIDDFITAYKREASQFGKVFYNNFAEYPGGFCKGYYENLPEQSEDEKKYWEQFEDVHILRIDEYTMYMAGWLAEVPLQDVGLISRTAHDSIMNAASALAEENSWDTSSVDVTPANIIFATWMKKCIDIFLNFQKLPELKTPQKIYYRGSLKLLSIYFLHFLSQLSCNILVEVDPSQQNIDEILAMIPKYMKVDILDKSVLDK